MPTQTTTKTKKARKTATLEIKIEVGSRNVPTLHEASIMLKRIGQSLENTHDLLDGTVEDWDGNTVGWIEWSKGSPKKEATTCTA